MKYYEIKIKISPSTTALLQNLNDQGLFLFEHYYSRDGFYHLESSVEEISILETYGIEVDIGHDLVERARTVQSQIAPGADTSDDMDDAISTGFVDHYMDKTEVFARMQTLATTFPSLCQLITLPYQTEGYDGTHSSESGPSDVIMLRITNTPALKSKPGLLLICGTHAREWVNPLIAVELAEQLLQNYDPASSDPEVMAVNRIVEEGDTLIVPIMNPDGYNFSFYDSALWRKNRKTNPVPATCKGVDNNRNFGIYFGEAGSSSDACAQTHRGTHAFSEKENQNIKFILDNYPNILIGVDSHSKGEKIFRPTASGGTFTSTLPVFPLDETIYVDLENAVNTAIQGINGKTYLTGTTSNHAGTSDEYMFFGHRIFAFDFECALSFQPPIEDALVSVQEVVAAMKALAIKGIDLDIVTPNPVSIIQCIDRTGSMVSFGYVDEAAANATRFCDLMSIGDSTGIVSFADPSSDPSATPESDRALLEFPLTTISTPGTYQNVKSAINGLSFGGWTSIGAGLLLAKDQLTGSSNKAIVLISDGFENRTPLISNVLSGFPSDIPVYAIALGSAADTSVLSDLAMDTGGRFYLSPDALDLHEIYNEIRSAVSDDDLVLNESFPADQDDDHNGHQKHHDLNVEQGANYLVVGLSYSKHQKSRVSLIDPSGYALGKSDWKLSVRQADKYQILRVRRPRPGRWRICISYIRDSYTVSAFVHSPLSLKMNYNYERLKDGYRIFLNPVFHFGDRKLSNFTTSCEVSHTGEREVYIDKREKLEWPELIPGHINFEQHKFNNLDIECHNNGTDIYGSTSVYRDVSQTGIYKIKVKVSGSLQDRSHFEREVTLFIRISKEQTPQKQAKFSNR